MITSKDGKELDKAKIIAASGLLVFYFIFSAIVVFLLFSGKIPAMMDNSPGLKREMSLVLGMGALGGCIHGLTSLGDYVGNGTLQMRWLIWFGNRPIVGGLLALVVYFVVRAGLSDSNNGFENLYAVAAVAALVGMFSKQATDWLSQTFDAIFRNKADERRLDSVKPDD